MAPLLVRGYRRGDSAHTRRQQTGEYSILFSVSVLFFFSFSLLISCTVLAYHVLPPNPPLPFFILLYRGFWGLLLPQPAAVVSSIAGLSRAGLQVQDGIFEVGSGISRRRQVCIVIQDAYLHILAAQSHHRLLLFCLG